MRPRSSPASARPRRATLAARITAHSSARRERGIDAPGPHGTRLTWAWTGPDARALAFYLLFTCRRSLFVFAQLGQHREVLERGRVAHRLLPRRDVAQQAPHDLAAACLGQGIRDPDLFRPRDGADLLDHVLLELGAQDLVGLEPAFRRHEGDEGLSLELVR